MSTTPVVGSLVIHKGITYVVVRAEDADAIAVKYPNTAVFYREQGASALVLRRPQGRTLYTAKWFLKTGNITDPMSMGRS